MRPATRKGYTACGAGDSAEWARQLKMATVSAPWYRIPSARECHQLFLQRTLCFSPTNDRCWDRPCVISGDAGHHFGSQTQRQNQDHRRLAVRAAPPRRYDEGSPRHPVPGARFFSENNSARVLIAACANGRAYICLSGKARTKWKQSVSRKRRRGCCFWSTSGRSSETVRS
mgnify:CR=1 FL=1